MRSIWEHLWTFYLIPLFFAIKFHFVEYDLKVWCRTPAALCSLSTAAARKTKCSPKTTLSVSCSYFRCQSGKDKARTAVKCLFCLCRRHTNLTALRHSPKQAKQGDDLASLLGSKPWAWVRPSLELGDEKRRALISARQRTQEPGHQKLDFMAVYQLGRVEDEQLQIIPY